MSLRKKIEDDLRAEMKAGDKKKLGVLRLIFDSIKNVEIDKKKKEEGLSDGEVIEVISRSVKQRKESIEQYEKGGRDDLVEKEKEEIEIISVYLPEQLGEDDIRSIVKEAIKKTGASSKHDMGKVMGQAMSEMKGKADGNLVRKVVQEELGN